jgi:hypothetical protein
MLGHVDDVPYLDEPLPTSVAPMAPIRLCGHRCLNPWRFRVWYLLSILLRIHVAEIILEHGT